MKVLFWIPYPQEGASNRLRVLEYLPYLTQEGIACVIHSFWSRRAFMILYRKGYYAKKIIFFLRGVIARIRDILFIYQYDLVFIHRESCPVGGAFFEFTLRLLGKPFVFDFDDAIFLPSSSSYNNFIDRFKRPGKVARIIKMSCCVIAGNSYLAEYAVALGHKNVHILPTPINTDQYYPRERARKGPHLVIGWFGSVTTIEFLAMMKNVFFALNERFKDAVAFKIVGGEFSLAGLPNIISKQWKMSEEIKDLESFDIGIMPMPDNAWTKGKCGFKAILYMSMGLPCVCSAVGMNCQIVDDGVNGFLARSEDEWIKKLSLLIQDGQLRERMGQLGRLTVQLRYSVKVMAPKLIALLKDCPRKNKLP